MAPTGVSEVQQDKSAKRLANSSLMIKLVLAFFGVSVIGCGAAGYSIYALTMIYRQLNNVVEVASPVSDYVQKMNQSIGQVQLLGVKSLHFNDQGRLAEVSREIDSQEKILAETFARLETLSKEKDVETLMMSDINSQSGQGDTKAATSKDVPSGLESIRESQRTLVAEVRQLIDAHRSLLAAGAMYQIKLDEFKAKTSTVQQQLKALVSIVETEFAANEEVSKTNVQAGTATVHDLYEMISQFYDEDYPMLSSSQKLESYISQLSDMAQRYLSEKNESELPKIQAAFENTVQTISGLADRLGRRSRSNEIRESLAKIRDGIADINRLALGEEGIFSVHKRTLNAVRFDKKVERMFAAASNCDTMMQSMANKATQVMESAKTRSSHVVASARRWELLLMIGGFGCSILVGLVLARNVSRPITTLAVLSGNISHGDLSVTIPRFTRGDEIGDLASGFEMMVGALREQTSRVLETASMLAALASENSATVAQLSRSTSSTSSAVSETSALSQQLRQSAKVSIEKAKSVADRARVAAEVSESGKRATENALEGMKLINDQMKSIGDTVVKLGDHSQAIENIISTVRDIADQSNLLAVNASIEAASAGEQGRGFAVVAQEIKSLADQSRDATQQVRTILDQIRKWISAAVMATEKGARAVDSGLTQAVSAGESIRILAENVQASSDASSVIEASAEQQFVGADQMSSAMAALQEAVSQNVQGLEQLENASNQLETLGKELRGLVEQFRI